MNKAPFMVSVVFVLTAGLPGCQEANRTTTNPADRPPTFYEDIVHISLLVDLPLIDEDGDHEPDGALVRVMLLRPGQPEYVAGKGSVIFHLYRRVRTESGPFVNQEMYTWKVSQEDFTRAVVRQRFGFIGHQLSIYWGNLRPTGPGVFLQAEFVRTDKQVLRSRPVSLALPEAPRPRR